MTGLEIGLIVYAAVTAPLVTFAAMGMLTLYATLKDARLKTKLTYRFCIELDEPDKFGVKSAVFATSKKVNSDIHQAIMKADTTRNGLIATTMNILKKNKIKVAEVNVLDEPLD